jgi:hypothetical protein
MFQLGEAETTAFDGLRKFVTDELRYPNHHRSVPVTTMSVLWLPQREQTRRFDQSGTAISGPYRLAISAGAVSTRWPQSRHHTIRLHGQPPHS